MKPKKPGRPRIHRIPTGGDPNPTRICTQCERDLDVNEFPCYQLESGRTKRRNWCRQCINDAQRAKNYGLSVDDYQNLVSDQNGLCKICSKQDSLVVDHCHETNKIRGLLCSQCNVGLGMFGDSVSTMLLAIDYLKLSNHTKSD